MTEQTEFDPHTFGAPEIWVPYVRVEGVFIRAEYVLWNSGKRAYWVSFGDGFRDWFAKCDVVWQKSLVFPEI